MANHTTAGIKDIDPAFVRQCSLNIPRPTFSDSRYDHLFDQDGTFLSKTYLEAAM